MEAPNLARRVARSRDVMVVRGDLWGSGGGREWWLVSGCFWGSIIMVLVVVVVVFV